MTTTKPTYSPTAVTYSLFPIPYYLNYAFLAKERDTETGLSYFGARYYSSNLSIWLSVDPMSDKYPSLSSYVYCADNPVKLVDPNGEDWYEDENGKMYFTDKYMSATAFARSGIKGTYRGKTYDKNGVYYSLFGSTLDSKDVSSNQIKLTKKIDEAFIKYAAYNKKCERSTGEYPARSTSDYSDFNDIIPFVDRFGTTDENQHDWDPTTKKEFQYAYNSKFRFTVVGRREKMFGHFYGFSTEYNRKDFGTGNIGYHLYIVNGKNKIIGLTFNKKENVEAFHKLYNALFK
ncbi:MAG: RHS repeat-associated core domain-containing protein [Bacteroidales bacterium]|nr:RHS repeat-associated core domain-containing protein [Bacteroidales bacterium]